MAKKRREVKQKNIIVTVEGGEIIKERMLRDLKDKIVNQWGGKYSDNEILEKLYLQDLNGKCIHDEFMGEDLLVEIRNKYRFFFGAICKEVSKSIEVWISPYYEDSTTVVIILDDKILYKDHIKPWNFWFESEEALTNEMYRIYQILLARSEKTWDCYTLSEGDIREVAEKKGIDLEGVDFDDVIHYIKKGIGYALENRDEIIETAIHRSRDRHV